MRSAFAELASMAPRGCAQRQARIGQRQRDDACARNSALGDVLRPSASLALIAELGQVQLAAAW